MPEPAWTITHRSKDTDDMADAILLAVGRITGLTVGETTETELWSAVEDILIFGAPVAEKTRDA